VVKLSSVELTTESQAFHSVLSGPVLNPEAVTAGYVTTADQRSKTICDRRDQFRRECALRDGNRCRAVTRALHRKGASECWTHGRQRVPEPVRNPVDVAAKSMS
jgi:hypothetical protein